MASSADFPRRNRGNDVCDRRGVHRGEGPGMRGRVSRGLHIRGRGPALHPSRRVNRLRRMRARMPGDRDLPGGGRPAGNGELHRQEQGRLQLRGAARQTEALTSPGPLAHFSPSRATPRGGLRHAPVSLQADERREAPVPNCVAAAPEPYNWRNCRWDMAVTMKPWCDPPQCRTPEAVEWFQGS